MCATIMTALQMLAIAPLSLRVFVHTLPCTETPCTCPSLSVSLLQPTGDSVLEQMENCKIDS